MYKNQFLMKFSIAAMVLGFLSPSIHIVKRADQAVAVKVSLVQKAEARRGGGARRGGAGRGRSRARATGRRSGMRARPSKMRRPATRPSRRPAGNRKKVTRNKNINRNVNRNVNRNINRNVNVNHYYGGGHHHHHHHHGHYGHYHGHPILAFGAAVAVGSIIAAATMPSSCVTVVHGGTSYRRCDSRYYKPVYQGDQLVYQVVPAPL